MTHALENALIAGGLISLFITPIYLAARRAHGKRVTLLNEKLQAALSQHNLSLTRSEHVGGKIIGWDQPNQTLIYADLTNPETLIYDLKQATKSYVLKSMNGSSVRSVLLQIADPKGKLISSLSFYQQFQDNEMKLNHFEKQARDWEQLLNAHLNK